MTDPKEAEDPVNSGAAGDEDKVEESVDVHFEPVIRLEQKVETKTNEEGEAIVYKMYVIGSCFISANVLDAQNCSDMKRIQMNGKSEEQVM